VTKVCAAVTPASKSASIYIYINADLLPPVVAMHACIILGLWEHTIPTACDVESRIMLVITDEKIPFVACIYCFRKDTWKGNRGWLVHVVISDMPCQVAYPSNLVRVVISDMPCQAAYPSNLVDMPCQVAMPSCLPK
jgi:hypothetical protein